MAAMAVSSRFMSATSEKRRSIFAAAWAATVLGADAALDRSHIGSDAAVVIVQGFECHDLMRQFHNGAGLVLSRKGGMAGPARDGQSAADVSLTARYDFTVETAPFQNECRDTATGFPANQVQGRGRPDLFVGVEQEGNGQVPKAVRRRPGP